MKKQKKNDLTRMMSQSEIVTLAVCLLGGDQHSVDTEDVAVKARELAPGRFCWRKYPQQINLELVRVYLSDAKKSEKGAYLSGSGRTGWALTQAGLEWARAVVPRIAHLNLARGRDGSKAGSVDEIRWRHERVRILDTAAWRRWVSGDTDVTVREACEVFRIDSYAVGRIRETKLTRLRALFQDDKELDPFLAHLSGIVRRAGEEQ